VSLSSVAIYSIYSLTLSVRRIGCGDNLVGFLIESGRGSGPMTPQQPAGRWYGRFGANSLPQAYLQMPAGKIRGRAHIALLFASSYPKWVCPFACVRHFARAGLERSTRNCAETAGRMRKRISTAKCAKIARKESVDLCSWRPWRPWRFNCFLRVDG